ncbi:hypothetical protein DL95DRAFT_388944, partial [Leptodontidium sp. 2 PMI_412]
ALSLIRALRRQVNFHQLLRLRRQTQFLLLLLRHHLHPSQARKSVATAILTWQTFQSRTSTVTWQPAMAIPNLPVLPVTA